MILCIGVVLTKGLFALSPIPVDEDEWESFQRMLRDPAYRLPATTRPRHYEVNLTPYFDNVADGEIPFTFDGHVTIYTSPTVSDVGEIFLHCNNMTILSLSVQYERDTETVIVSDPDQSYECDTTNSFLRIPVTTPLILDQEYIISSTFRGHLQTNMRGFYRSWYRDSTGSR